MKNKRSVSFVIAGYNEACNVENTISETWNTLNENFENFELILIDDASKDNTLELMKKQALCHANIRIMENHVNLNFGSSVLRGLKAAAKEYVVYNAFDLPLKPEVFVEKFAEMDSDTDLLVLQRYDYAATGWRKATSFFNSLLLKALFPRLVKGTPVLNFTQIYRRAIIGDIMPLARSPIFVWPELIFRSKLKGFRVKNTLTACHVQNVRKGAFGHPHDIIWGIYDMLRFRIRLWQKNI